MLFHVAISSQVPHQSSSLPSFLHHAFFNFLFLLESLSLLLLTLLASYLQGWRLNNKPPPVRDTSQGVVFVTQNHGCHVAGPGHLPQHGLRAELPAWWEETTERLRVSGAGQALQNTRTWERTGPLRVRGPARPPGTESASLGANKPTSPKRISRGA